ncbi:hypothetical protein HRR93_001126 [Exophiala dermatitidis]|nr:hypothetical protein HRR93_001126 [Exophiala dermatitidis]
MCNLYTHSTRLRRPFDIPIRQWFDVQFGQSERSETTSCRTLLTLMPWIGRSKTANIGNGTKWRYMGIQHHPMTPSPRILLFRLSQMETVLPTIPSPPTPRFSRRSPVVEVATGLMKNECMMGLEDATAASDSASESEDE